MSTTRCPLCGREVAENLYSFHEQMDKIVIEMIQAQHPEWVAADGSCPQCVEYYRRQVKE